MPDYRLYSIKNYSSAQVFNLSDVDTYLSFSFYAFQLKWIMQNNHTANESLTQNEVSFSCYHHAYHCRLHRLAKSVSRAHIPLFSILFFLVYYYNRQIFPCRTGACRTQHHSCLLATDKKWWSSPQDQVGEHHNTCNLVSLYLLYHQMSRHGIDYIAGAGASFKYCNMISRMYLFM